VSRGAKKNGFDLSDSLIPESEIRYGGPPRDGLLAIDQPKFASKLILKGLPKNERALVIEMGKEKKAYPFTILNWHEVVNDVIDGKKIIVTFCPLCGTGMVFEPRSQNKESRNKELLFGFGISGLLYKNNVLLYDRGTKSLWSQVMMKAITGKMKGARLKLLRSSIVNLHDYVKQTPEVRILSRKTGHYRDYSKNPYKDYEQSKEILFPQKDIDHSHHPKEWTLLLKSKADTLLVPLTKLDPKKKKIRIKLGPVRFSLYYNVENRTFKCDLPPEIDCVAGYWFTLRSFYPKATVFGS